VKKRAVENDDKSKTCVSGPVGPVYVRFGNETCVAMRDHARNAIDAIFQ
jgi:hypothetical protein